MFYCDVMSSTLSKFYLFSNADLSSYGDVNAKYGVTLTRNVSVERRSRTYGTVLD